MRRQTRRASARDWIRSDAAVSVRTYAKRYGVDRYTAYDDLLAIGFPLTPDDERWAVRPVPATDGMFEWTVVGDQRIWVVGYTSGGMPYGLVEEIEYDESGYGPEPF